MSQLTDEEFDKLVAEKQHEEFMITMKRLISVLDNVNDTTELELAVNKLNNHLDRLIGSGLKVDMKDLVRVLQNTKPIKTKDPDEIEQWTFHVNRNSAGYIDTVTATKF